MRLRNVPGARETIIENQFSIQQPEQMKGKWHEVFQNDHPIHIEVGMGKGQFIIEMARRNPEVNYIGIEKYSSVLVRAVEKLEDFEQDNLRLIRMDAENIEEVFDKDEVDRIYLNFSDPWPKDRHAKRRLTSPDFMAVYSQILAGHGTVEFKTDNKGLFDYSLEAIPEAGWTITAHTFDLHHDPVMSVGNIMTEYEEKFSSMGNPICKLIAMREPKETTENVTVHP